MRNVFAGSIPAVREVEDSIRATKKYTKGAFTKHVEHPIQGADFPSRLLVEYYEVYPDLEISWDMSAQDAWAWVWGDVMHIDVQFKYDYRGNKGVVVIRGGNDVVSVLKKGIPRFAEALSQVKLNGKH